LIIDKLGLNFPVIEQRRKKDQQPVHGGDVRIVLDVKPLFMPEKPEAFDVLLEKTFMPEQAEDNWLKRLRLGGEPPANLVVRIERNFTAPVERVIITNEMMPVLENNVAILKPVQQRKVLPLAEVQAKNNAKIDFEGINIDAIKLGDYFIEKNDATYKIIAVNIHLGQSQEGGHYISYVRVGDDWFLMDDNDAPKKVDIKNVPFGNASMLTMVKVAPQPVEEKKEEPAPVVKKLKKPASPKRPRPPTPPAKVELPKEETSTPPSGN
jgi:hypothetical protein